MKKSRGDSLHCSLVHMTLEANSMVHSQWLNLLGRSPGVQSPLLEVMGCPVRSSRLHFPWWRSALLNLFNLCLSWNDVPTMWKHSVIVPVFKTGDHSVPGNYRPISLASCCFKVLEHMVHSRIAPCISPQLHQCQGGFRWGADVMAGSLIDVLHMRSATHTFVAFVDIFKAFDISWVEATLVELFSMGVHGR